MKGATPALDVIASRRSVRSFSSKHPPDAAIDLLIEAGRRAPSAHNSQPWIFSVLRSDEEKEGLARAMRGVFLRYLRSQGDASPAEKADLAYKRTASAPVLILLSLDLSQLRSQPTPSRRYGERLMGSQSVAAAAQNILLAAHASGLGGCWRGAPIFCAFAVRRALELPSHFYPQVLLEIGYPLGKAKRKKLKAKDEVVRYGIGWR
ncbi:MAG: nitroreductase family protein [Conexivisphaerales archaeon]|jgi:F420 biosynthesis protein FbiB-like protein